MKPLNHIKRRKQIRSFALYFSFLLIVLFVCGSFTLNTASLGIKLLNDKKSSYDAIFKKQDELNFQLEDIYKNINSLQIKRRTVVEHREMQRLITDAIINLEDLVDADEQNIGHYDLYIELFDYLKEIQSIMNVYEKEETRRRYNIDQLERCKKKYEEMHENLFN